MGRIDDGAWRGVLVGSAVGFFGPFFSGKAGRIVVAVDVAHGGGFRGSRFVESWVGLHSLFLSVIPSEQRAWQAG